VREVVIPLGNGASTLSAYGIAATDVVRLFERQCSLFAPFDADALQAVVAEIEDRATAAMTAAGFTPDEVIFERVAVMRYAEQFLHELPLPLAPGPIDAQACELLASAFDAEYARLYGEGARSIFQAVEVFAIRVAAKVPLQFAAAAANPTSPNGAVTSERVRQVYWPEERAWVPTAVHDGQALHPGHTLHGPAIVELPHTSVVAAAGQRVIVDPVGNLVLSL
jgi:N-methylhydantoinase A